MQRSGIEGKARRSRVKCNWRKYFSVWLRMPEQEEIMFIIPAIDMVQTGKNIVKFRKAAGLSVRDLQMIFGFATPQAIYKWQQGLALPAIDNLVVLAAVLHVKVDDIIAVDIAKNGTINDRKSA